jgi:hypothetical protein
MYPLTHAYVIRQIFGEETTDAHILGAIFPDAVLAFHSITRDDTHTHTQCILEENRESSELRDFVLGATSHGTSPKCLDYYGDENYDGSGQGFSFLKGADYQDRIVRMCELPVEMAPWRAHNFVEMAMELHITNKDPSNLTTTVKAYNNLPLIRYISMYLADYYRVDPREILTGILGFRQIFSRREITPKKLAQSFQIQLLIKHLVLTENIEEMATLLIEIEETLANDFDEFLTFVIPRLKAIIDSIA